MIKNWSRAILALIVLPIVVAVSAVLSTMSSLVIATLFPLLLVALLLNFNAKSRITVSIEGERNVVYVGDEVSFRATVTVEEGFGLLFLRLPATDSFELMEKDTNVHILFKGFRKVEQRSYVYRMKALRRGVFKLPDISYSYYPPLSVSHIDRGSLHSNIQIKVLPKVQILKRSQVSLRSLYEMPRTSRARLGPHSTDFLSIRNYTMGDPYKFINWKASSRNTSPDTLLVNEYEREGLRTFLFILDRSDVMRRGTAEENSLEYGIAFILSYAKILLNQGMNVGLWLEPEDDFSASQRYESYIIPSSGTDHYQRLKELLVATELREPGTATEEPSLNFTLHSSLLLRIVRETVPSIIFVTNFEKSNREPVSRFARELLGVGAHSLTILDVIPYNIISKYSSPIPYSTDSASQSAGLLLKSILISTKKKDQYSILPKGVKVIAWDPSYEPIGRAIKMSMSLMKRNPRRS